jgi:hypothetical protein
VQENYAQGNKNYEEAVGQEMQLPNVFNPATTSETAAVGANSEALKAQQAVDTANNWWQPMVTAAIGGASSALTGGITGGMGAPKGGGGETIAGGTQGWANDEATAFSQGGPVASTSSLPNQL